MQTSPRLSARGVWEILRGPMSQENVEIARRMCEAAWRRPKPDYDTISALGHPDHEMFTVQSLVEGGGYRGAEGFREWLVRWGEMFGEDWESSVEKAEPVDVEAAGLRE